jgi:hypothetical protein
LVVVISAEFLIKDPLGLLDIGDILSHTGSDRSILEPTIRSLNLPSGLRRQGIGHFYIAILQNLFPFRGCFISPQMVASLDRVPPLDKSEDRVRIDIIGVRKSIAKDDGL